MQGYQGQEGHSALKRGRFYDMRAVPSEVKMVGGIRQSEAIKPVNQWPNAMLHIKTSKDNVGMNNGYNNINTQDNEYTGQ